MVEVVTAFWEWEVGRMKGRKHEPLVFKSSREDVPKWCYSGVVEGWIAWIGWTCHGARNHNNVTNMR